MKIGILSSWNDTLSLFKFLHRHNHEYVIWYDDLFSFWWDKPLDVVIDRVKFWLDFLQKQGVEAVLLSPILELLIKSEKIISAIKVINLFETYLKDYCFTYSLVGKIWFIGDWLDIKYGQEYINQIASSYDLTDNQRNIKKFHFPFAYRGKEIRNWKYMLDSFSRSDPIVNRLIKLDLRYFKDANVDTIIPLTYNFLNVEKTIDKALNHKKIRFHGIDILEKIFLAETKDKNSSYSVSVYFTAHGEFLQNNKKMMRLLARWKENIINFESSN